MSSVCLIAEASPPLTHHLRHYAELYGLRVIHVTEGERVVEMAHQIRFAVILLNIELPGRVRGWEALKLLKSDAATLPIPVVAYCLSEEEEFRHMEEANATFCMPILYSEFKHILGKAGVPIPESVS